MRDAEDIGRRREVVDIVLNEIVYFICVVFHFQGGGSYLLGIYEPPNALDFGIVPHFMGFLLCVDLIVGRGGVSSS